VTAPAPQLAPYEAIVAHAELELELAGRGDLDGLAGLGPRWDELEAGLPATAPPGALALLERARLIAERARIDLLRMREAVLADHAGTLHARRAADGYGRERPRTPYLDRSA